ncbi:AAA family ATPase, partial [Nitrospirales bacterium NOB]|nr:AAA family ATPase [Nitrospirales bacterium NOB]
MNNVPTSLAPAEAVRQLNLVRQEIGKVIVGQQDVLDGVLICLLSGGHVLLE